MSPPRLQANLPLTDEKGKLTPVAMLYFEELFRVLRDHEARITALEP